MSEEELTRLLTLATEDVRPTLPASTGWERARRTRRTRRAAGAVAVAVVLLTAATALALRPADRPPPVGPATVTAAPVPSASPVQRPPDQLTYPGGPLGRLGDPPIAPLSARPVRQALALYQPVDRNTGVEGRIRVLGDDGLVRDLDVVTPAPTRDAAGNTAVALKSGSLSPDGRLAAFAQTNEVIVVDLATPGVRRYPLSGYLEHVVWAGDRLLVGDDDTLYEVDRGTGATREVPTVSPWDVVTPDPSARTDDLLTVGGMREGMTLSRRTSTAAGTQRHDQPLDFRALPADNRVDEFYGRGWQRGDQVARAGWITSGNTSGLEGAAVLNTGTGVVTRLLDLGRDRWKGCCEVLGWDRDGAVLLRHNPGGLVRWQPSTGAVTGVVRDLYGQVSLATG
ncbi:hypothetical protein [Micromonospora sp. WMMD812]|uniref:hypothetical protein n=1 Tax=Micromonospora sp. WMMD812 TaxID=3015152 RepID=UPI00248C0AF8|nr:hypothetical protein [Micromonospora sp. WMMD812]WBB65726.1 hypothetical protein O7603_21310 [Micromonospora sp. WMMD812]